METEYIFGPDTLKTVGPAHTGLEGWNEVERKFPQETILDHFRVVRKTKSGDDAEGRCYDWYEIDKHYRIVDKTPPINAEQANQDELLVDQEYRLTMIELGV